jgi:hypothetical protein
MEWGQRVRTLPEPSALLAEGSWFGRGERRSGGSEPGGVRPCLANHCCQPCVRRLAGGRLGDRTDGQAAPAQFPGETASDQKRPIRQASWEDTVPRETGANRELHRFPDVWFSELFSRMTTGLRSRLLSIGKYHAIVKSCGCDFAVRQRRTPCRCRRLTRWLFSSLVACRR